jgi:hypothetical protein
VVDRYPGPLLVGVIATAIVWATSLASFAARDDVASLVLGFFVLHFDFTFTLSLGE